ncbi:MAG: hypothetical protein P4M11_13720 [Candidatus Pacebacteria bacterium]|nr:hypothetical protein [Candidatus Paceibacterota bacterium]
MYRLMYHLNVAASEIQQKSVRSFKENLKERRNPFFVRCFLKLGIIIFLFILASASTDQHATEYIVIEYVLLVLDINFVDTSFSNALLVHQRLAYLLNIPQSFRSIYDVYQGYENNTSEAYSDRIDSYMSIVLLASLFRIDIERARKAALSVLEHRQYEAPVLERTYKLAQFHRRDHVRSA